MSIRARPGSELPHDRGSQLCLLLPQRSRADSIVGRFSASAGGQDRPEHRRQVVDSVLRAELRGWGRAGGAVGGGAAKGGAVKVVRSHNPKICSERSNALTAAADVPRSWQPDWFSTINARLNNRNTTSPTFYTVKNTLFVINYFFVQQQLFSAANISGFCKTSTIKTLRSSLMLSVLPQNQLNYRFKRGPGWVVGAVKWAQEDNNSRCRVLPACWARLQLFIAAVVTAAGQFPLSPTQTAQLSVCRVCHSDLSENI